MPTADDFRDELIFEFEVATRDGRASIIIEAGGLHERVGGYSGSNHRMPVCCSVMEQEMVAGDRIISSPPKGKGASLTIEYQLPRRNPVFALLRQAFFLIVGILSPRDRKRRGRSRSRDGRPTRR
jgi:hypothetical protein